jgi:hypothetical protein
MIGGWRMRKSNMIDSFAFNIISKKLSTLVFRLSLIILIAGGLFLVQSGANAYAQDCDLVPGNPIANCGFETGDFAGWVTQDLATPFFPLQVNVAGVSPGFGLFLSNPTQGVFAALNGFDGDGPGTIRIAQDVVLPHGSDQLVFDYECGWNTAGFGATEDRTFEVNIEPSGGGVPLQTDLILTAQAQTIVLPSIAEPI